MGQKLNKTVNKINNTVSPMIGMKPRDAVKLDTIPLDKTYPKETIIPEDGFYRYFYQPGEQNGDQKRWATVLIWIKNTYRLDQIVQDSGNCVLKYWQDGSDKASVREELIHVSENTQIPPDWVSEWK